MLSFFPALCWTHCGPLRPNGIVTLQWCHNGCDGVSNHQPHDCFINRLFRQRSKKTSKLRVTGLCARNSPVTGEFPAQKASNAENVSIWWRHHGTWSWLLSVMACRLFVDNPLLDIKLTYCQLNLQEQINVKFISQIKDFHPRKYGPNCPRWIVGCLV